jgi:putative hydrolase of the HAD superfamily
VIPRPRAVLFDLFHTLVAMDRAGGTSTTVWEDLGLPREAWEQRWFDDRDGRATGTVRDTVEVIRMVAHALDPAIPHERVAWAAERRAARFARALREVEPGVVHALARLRGAGVRLALVSNACRGEIEGWSASPLAPFFDAAVFSCEVGMVKPDPEIFEHALGRLGERADTAIFVGDGGSDEHRGARAVSLRTALVTRYASRWWPEKMAARREGVHWEFEDVPAFVDAIALHG